MPPKPNPQYGSLPATRSANSTVNVLWCFLVIIGIVALVALILGWYAAANVPNGGNQHKEAAVFCFHGVQKDNLLETNNPPIQSLKPLILGSVAVKDYGTRLCWDLQYISNVDMSTFCSIASISFRGPTNITNSASDPTIRVIKDMGFVLSAGRLTGCHAISRTTARQILREPSYYYVQLAFRNFAEPENEDGCTFFDVRGYLSGICHAPFFHATDDDDDDDLGHFHHGSGGGSGGQHSSNSYHSHNFDSQSPPAAAAAAVAAATAKSHSKFTMRAPEKHASARTLHYHHGAANDHSQAYRLLHKELDDEKHKK